MTEVATPVAVAPIEGSPEAIEAQVAATLMDEDAPVVTAKEVIPPEVIPPVVVAPVVNPVVVPPVTEPVVAPVVDPAPAAPVKTGDPFLDGYNATPAEKRAEYIANYNQASQVINMDTDAGLKYVYQQVKDAKGERAYTDADIDADIAGRSKLSKDREWNQMQETMKLEQARALEVPVPTQAQVDTYIANANTAVIAKITPMLLAEDAMTEVHGLPYTPEMKATFKEDFTKLNLTNPKTGDPYLYEFLSADDNLRDMVRAYSLSKGNKLNVFLSNFKEDFKEDTFNKLGVSLKPQGGVGAFSVAQTEDDLD